MNPAGAAQGVDRPRLTLPPDSATFSADENLVDQPLDLSCRSPFAVNTTEAFHTEPLLDQAVNKKIVRITAMKPRKLGAKFEVLFENEILPRWVDSNVVSDKLKVAFLIDRHVK